MVLRRKKTDAKEEIDAYWRTIYWFFSFPTKELGLGDLSSELGISKTTANRVVSQLADEDFLKKEVLGRTWRISCNHSHPYFITRKRGYNLVLIYESGILGGIYKRIPNARAIVLFGSYRWGNDVENSDVDIAVEIIGDEEVQLIPLEPRQIGYRRNVPVNLYVFSRNKIDLNLFANIANGIVLEGFLEVRP